MGEGTKGCVAGTDADRHYAPHGQFPLPIAQLLLQSCGERGKCLLLEVHAGPEAGPWHGLCWARCRLGAGGLPRHISKIVCLTKRVKRRAGFRSAPGAHRAGGGLTRRDATVARRRRTRPDPHTHAHVPAGRIAPPTVATPRRHPSSPPLEATTIATRRRHSSNPPLSTFPSTTCVNNCCIPVNRRLL